MARPRKNSADKHACVLSPVRCTKTERDDIKAKAGSLRMNTSEYIREMALYGKVVVQETKYDFELINQLRRIGTNINQQTKRLNSTGHSSKELTALWGKLNSILDDIIEKA